MAADPVISRKLPRPPEPLPYLAPAVASEAGKARAKYLCTLRNSRFRADELRKYPLADQSMTLECLARDLSKEFASQRFKPGTKGPRNAEFMVSLILRAEGLVDAIPRGWDTPRDHQSTASKRARGRSEAVLEPEMVRSSNRVVTLDCSGASRLPKALWKSTWLSRHPALDIALWKGFSDSTAEEQDSHSETVIRSFHKMCSGVPNATVRTVLNDYQRWCMATYQEMKPILSIEMFERHLTWLAEDKSRNRTVEEGWTRARHHLETLAQFHGYVPTDFIWQHSRLAKHTLHHKVVDRAALLNLDTDGPTVKSHRHQLTTADMERLPSFIYSMQAASIAHLAAFIGITNQTLARPGQICALNRCHLTINPEADMPVQPSFGPVKMLQLGDRGHHKVADKGVDMTHFVMRTLRQSLVCPWFGLALNAALQAAVQGPQRYGEMSSQATVNVLARKGLKDAEEKPKIKWRMNPVLAGGTVHETDTFQAQCAPYSRIETNDLGKLVKPCLKFLEIAESRKGRSTILFRHYAVGILHALRVNEEDITSISKHVKDATAIRGHYKFKHAEVYVIMKAAGYCEGIYDNHYAWEGSYIQGRQLATADLIQAQWPGKWEQFCEAVFPGLLAFKAQVDGRGNSELNAHEEDMRMQAYVDYELCQTLLQDSAFHRWDLPDSPLWRAIPIFEDPTTAFMCWHHDDFSPWVRQLQHDANRCHASIRNQRGGRTVLDTARDNLGIETASTLEQSRGLLQEMIRLQHPQISSVKPQLLPASAPSLPSAPEVHVAYLRMPKEVIGVKVLKPLWDLWEAKLRQYYSLQLKHTQTPPPWAGRDKEKFQDRQDMLLELDAQVTEAVARKKGGEKRAAADRQLAGQQVLVAWHARMNQYRFTAQDGTERVISLTPNQVAAAFQQACKSEKGINKLGELVKLQKGTKKPGGETTCEQVGFAVDFLRTFRARI